MPRIHKIDMNPKAKATYATLADDGEKNHCALVAAKMLTGKGLPEVRKAFKEAGREDGTGTSAQVTTKAYELLGFELRKMPPSEVRRRFINKYPGVHKNLKNVTSHHPRRFPKAWEDAPELLLCHSTDHAWAVVKGENHDWSVNKQRRATDIFVVTAIGEEAKPEKPADEAEFFEGLSIAQLTTVYNALVPESDQIKKFSNKTTALERTGVLLEEKELKVLPSSEEKPVQDFGFAVLT